jgi:IclR family transcriptional regulator, acetate operon repressor
MRNHLSRSTARRARVARPVDVERDDKYFSKVIGKAFDILGILRAAPQPLSLSDLTMEIGLAKSSVFRMLYTLEVSGYVERDASGRYRASGGIRALVREPLRSDLTRVANPHMRALNQEFRETVSVAMRFDNRIEVIDTIDSPQTIRMGNIVGRILPPHASSLGKVIAAYTSEGARDRLIHSYGLHRFTPHTITGEVELRHEYERVRIQGFSVDAEESVLEGRCFGAPIFNPAKEVIGALSVSVPKMRIQDKDEETRLITAVRATAQQISGALLLALGRSRRSAP